MNTQRPADNSPNDYPPSLDGGEAPSHSDHRIGETQRQSPKVDQVDPAGAQPARQSPDTDQEDRPAS